ncbi:lipoyl(octanoyl) transferase LipB [Candidatus Sumerlaeota bacterium]|nr:lipoyl(octanoyl) transferase LipB [Candidatus Sumerlaeota bacterium]
MSDSCENGMNSPAKAVWQFRNLGRLDWDTAAREQERVADAIARGECPGTVLFVEHNPVYTYGLRFRPENFRRRFDPTEATYCGVPVRRAFRGGELTYHGPGQLVAYPILRLPQRAGDLRQLVAFYGDVVIASLNELGIAGFVRADAIGVWTERGKIASIGVGLRRGVTRNGFAVNVAVDRQPFDLIVPCGLTEPIANVADFTHSRISIDDVRVLIQKYSIRLGNRWLEGKELPECGKKEGSL